MGDDYNVVRRVMLRDFEMPKRCRDCEFEGLPAYVEDPNLPIDTALLPNDDDLPFCVITMENISDDTVRAAHCRLKEVDVLEKAPVHRPRTFNKVLTLKQTIAKMPAGTCYIICDVDGNDITQELSIDDLQRNVVRVEPLDNSHVIIVVSNAF